jgi:hypothetical protein
MHPFKNFVSSLCNSDPNLVSTHILHLDFFPSLSDPYRKNLPLFDF